MAAAGIPADAVLAFPAGPDDDVTIIDLMALLVGGGSEGLDLGRSGPADVEKVLGPAGARWPDGDRLYLDFPHGVRATLSEGRLSQFRYDSLIDRVVVEADSRGSDLRGHDDIGLAEIYLGEGDSRYLRLGGRCAGYFATLPKLMSYAPPGLNFEFRSSVTEFDSVVLAFATRGSRELRLVYAIKAFEDIRRRTLIHFDYCLREAAVLDAELA